jgi:hypothetical protein
MVMPPSSAAQFYQYMSWILPTVSFLIKQKQRL